MAANDKCKAREILQNEVQSEDGTTGTGTMNRLFVNPEFIQDLDQSDGSKQFDDENEEFEEDEAKEYIVPQHVNVFLIDGKDGGDLLLIAST